LLETQREQMGAVAAMVLSTPENILVEHAAPAGLPNWQKSARRIGRPSRDAVQIDVTPLHQTP
jgi:hypothetical protein